MGIKFTNKDLMRMKHPTVGFHLFKCLEVKEIPEPKKDRIRYDTSWEVTDSEDKTNIGRFASRSYYSTASGFLIPLLQAVWNVTKEEAYAKIEALIQEDQEFDVKSIVGAEVYNNFEEKMFNEKLQHNMSDEWSPNTEVPW
jgi:hypothetical protein